MEEIENKHTLLFYKFVDIKNPEKFAGEHMDFCKRVGLLGRIIIAKEGINGSVGGTKKQVDDYKDMMRKDEKFFDISFKEDIGKSTPFTKMKVLVKDEIIAMKRRVDMGKKAQYISPEELLKMYESGEDFIILDARNDYEWKVGKFKNAMTLQIKTFRQFPEELDKIKGKLFGKKVVSYCTGGIRCEKATAYMKEIGIEEVYQLEDGIINFCKVFPDTKWEGKCFVFDKRLIADYNNEKKNIVNCELCEGNCDLYRNCKSAECDKLVVMCVSCEKKMNGCCSESCLGEFKEFCRKKAFARQGRKTLISSSNPVNN